jgi:dihydrofolate reductase
MKLAAIVAMTENRVIGKNNALPWHLPQDLQHFKRLTMGKPIIMGRKTYMAIGRVLPGRLNIILSRQQDLLIPTPAVLATTPTLAIALAQGATEALVIGGAEIYQLLLPQLERIYMTLVHTKLIGDSYFPELLPQEWHQNSNDYHPADSQHAYSYSFISWERLHNSSKKT